MGVDLQGENAVKWAMGAATLERGYKPSRHTVCSTQSGYAFLRLQQKSESSLFAPKGSVERRASPGGLSPSAQCMPPVDAAKPLQAPDQLRGWYDVNTLLGLLFTLLHARACACQSTKRALHLLVRRGSGIGCV